MAADKIQPLNVKLGLWETTHTTTMSGEMPIPPEMLAKLTPEQRAKMEERMKANSAGRTTTSTSKSCLTKEKLEQAPFSDRGKECAPTILTSTSSNAVIKFTCDMSGMKMSGTINVEALTPENVKGSAQTTATGNHTMNVNATFTSKWLGSSCGYVH
jgi:hypothetical protein